MKRMFKIMPALSLLAAGAALAQQQAQPLTHVALFRIKPGKGIGWLALTKKLYVPVMEKLMADGVVLAYGLDTDILHNTDMPNADAWYTVPNYENYEKVQSAIFEIQAKNPEVMKELMDATDPDKHSDLLLRSVLSNGKPVPARSAFLSVSRFKAKPGKGPDLRKGFEAYAKPIYDKLLADGAIFRYDLDVEAEHSAEPGYYFFAVLMPSLAAQDKIRAAFRQADEKRSEAEREAADRYFDETTVEAAHRDSLARAEVFAAK